MKILLLEDDIILSEILHEHLSEQGFIVDLAFDGEDAYDKILANSYDLLLLDVNVPTLDGFELLRVLKEQSITTPTIFITSLESAKDLKRGFDLGCDDYLKKPFELLELDTRINYVLKSLQSTKITIDAERYLDKLSFELVDCDKRVKLSNKEFQIVEYLLKHKESVTSHQELIANIWQDGQIPSEATIRTYIKNIRSLFGKEFITTIKGVGYRINC
ncbi:MAG: response regulator transcription factor [Sulfurimonas sp.]|uniref:response regulator transcription factor n=1 Tax=Sulfurimonas sp. TaxID=2022749 RepID=UPI0025DE0D2C|nr:response regulator transcription factor [Sulfurimonas sp.]MCK9491048.1 response regulator transcription factor [Sulfurimonas sp.]